MMIGVFRTRKPGTGDGISASSDNGWGVLKTEGISPRRESRGMRMNRTAVVRARSKHDDRVERGTHDTFGRRNREKYVISTVVETYCFGLIIQ